MGVYTRFKRGPEGFRALVELLETTPLDRRKKMLDVGMAEDAEFTQRAQRFMLTFEDLTQLPEPELAELMAVAPARVIACAIHNADVEIQRRFLRCARPAVATSIKEYLGGEPKLREIGGARLKLVETARKLERDGYIRTKKIPAA